MSLENCCFISPRDTAAKLAVRKQAGNQKYKTYVYAHSCKSWPDVHEQSGLMYTSTVVGLAQQAHMQEESRCLRLRIGLSMAQLLQVLPHVIGYLPGSRCTGCRC